LGFRLSGKVAPDTEKPVPLMVAELMDTGAVPVELRVSDWVAALLSATLPKAMVLALTVNVWVDAPKWRAKVLEAPPEVAVRVAVAAVLTAATDAEKLALVAPADTVTAAGTVTALLSLEIVTLCPPVEAAELSVTVQLLVPAPV